MLFRSKNAHPDWSPDSWALRFAAGLDGVMVVLSGMSNQAQLDDNTSFMQSPAPLQPQDVALLEKAAEIISAVPAIACTACRYCVDGCPRNIPIPDYFAMYNASQSDLRQGLKPDSGPYQTLASTAGKASACIACQQCEQSCPQHLPIIDWLKRVAKLFEG